MRSHKQSSLRIIGGKWRGRKLYFDDAPGLRPTHDRVRETLFNWLQHDVVTANCLDLFAGSGALGFEALSRGAAHVTFVDVSRNIIKKLKENIAVLHADNSDLHVYDFTKRLDLPFQQQFDIIFLDPPFHNNLLMPAIDWLVTNNLLAKNALVYIEVARGEINVDKLPPNLEVLKHKHTKTLEYLLCRC